MRLLLFILFIIIFTFNILELRAFSGIYIKMNVIEKRLESVEAMTSLRGK